MTFTGSEDLNLFFKYLFLMFLFFLSIDKWIKKLIYIYIYVCIYNKILFNLGGKKENLPFVTNTGESEGLMPSEINQPQKDKCCLSDLIHELSHFSCV